MSDNASPETRSTVPPPVDSPDTGDGEWLRVSPRYTVVVLLSVAGTGLVLALACLVPIAFGWPMAAFAWPAFAMVVLWTTILLFLTPRRVRSIGYRLRRDDLLFRRGVLLQRVVAVPYGRMQLVDIVRGPVARWLGLADLKFVTAAAATAVSIPGLPLDAAEHLRERLVALAETRRAGL